MNAILRYFLVFFGAATLTSHALIPEPGNIYYGLARDVYGSPYQAGQDVRIQLVRIVGIVDDPYDNIADDDVVIAESEILNPQAADGRVNFILRPSLDGGTTANRYSTKAARVNDVVAIYVVDNGVRLPVLSQMNCAALSDPVPVIGSRGATSFVNVRAIDDYDANCLSDSWEYWFFGGVGVDPLGDEDGDGIDNLAEFVAATHPLVFDTLDLSIEKLGLAIERVNGKFRMSINKQSGRTYEMEWSTDLKTWETVPSSRLSGVDGNEVDTTGLGESVFFRYRVSRSK